ncbi:hypothetical protein VE03_07220 [Pseudogymnoascus sp. 23342-1-I1]|nr:hypothetical protein VE03_07220 [Pseudogymnoascus sp. 23342-1-I1]
MSGVAAVRDMSKKSIIRADELAIAIVDIALNGTKMELVSYKELVARESIGEGQLFISSLRWIRE